MNKADIKKFLTTAILVTSLDKVNTEVKAARIKRAENGEKVLNFELKCGDLVLEWNGIVIDDVIKIVNDNFKAPESEKPRNARGLFDKWIDPKFPKAVPGSIRPELGWEQVSFPIPVRLGDELRAAGLTYKTALLKGLASAKLFDALAKDKAEKDKAAKDKAED